MGRVPFLLLILAILCSTAREFSCNVNAQLANCLESDQEALIDFKIGLEDPGKRLSSWKGRNCCQWWGIGCENSTGAVVTINLQNPYPSGYDSEGRYKNCFLSGEIRPSLMKLKSLRNLDLSFNKFNYIPIPEFFGSLKNLQYLSLSTADFSGTIPQNLANLSSLQYLDVSSSGLPYLAVRNFEWVAGLTSLKHLAMNGVDLSSVGVDWIGVLNKLPNLTELHLSSCDLPGSIQYLSFINFTSLSVIDLSSNSFTSKFPDWLLNISSLESVDISRSGLFGGIPLGLSELPNLRFLKLSGNDNLRANCSKLFRGSWKRMEVLHLSSTKLHGKLPASIGNMTSLADINLLGNLVEGGVPSSIGKLCNLSSFDISHNNLTGSLPEFLERAEDCLSESPLPSLRYLILDHNQLVGKLPDWLGQLENLQELHLHYNSLQGPIPASLGKLLGLTGIGLGRNKLNGTLPESFGQLSELLYLDVSLNQLTGIVTEKHFSKLSKLDILDLSSNSFSLNVSSNWVPPFQVWYLSMGSFHWGHSFPPWLETQKKVQYLDISNTSISGSMPNWFWDISPNLSLLNVSFNQLQGQIPNPLPAAASADLDFSSNLFTGPIPFPTVEIQALDLSNNQFSSPIPPKIGESMPNLRFISLSGNHITGKIPASIGQMHILEVMDLSRNKLVGGIPSTIENCWNLKALDFGYNNLSGEIPGSLGLLIVLQSLHLNNNMLSGELPSSFQNLWSLETLDLGDNRLRGSIPPWIGDSFAHLRILRLRSNAFSGELPPRLSNLTSLQVLDLAENELAGTIPATFGDFKAMAQRQRTNQYLAYGVFNGLYYKENLVVITKGQSLTFTKTLSLVISIDLSGNHLHGEIPNEITKLLGLAVLNLSRNHISGLIPESISQLHELSSLDLSSNDLSGVIPPSMCSLTFLSYLNLSNNNLSGRIPYTGQMTTFTESSFSGNPGLCGVPPLTVNCQGDDPEVIGIEKDDDNWVYMSVGLGFAVGILVPCFILAIKKSWAYAYFGFVDDIIERLSWVRNRTSLHRRNRRRQL